MNAGVFDLDKMARERWAGWIQAALTRHGASQKELAIEIGQDDGSSKRSEVSRFVNGDEGALRAWFTRHPERVNILARHAGLSVDELRAKLAALQRGELEPEMAWHPAFPELRLEDVEIPAALEGERGETLEGVIAQVVSRLGDPKQWSSSAKYENLGLVGPAGRGRDVAARQVRARLQARLDAVRSEAVAKVAADQAKDRRGRQRETAEIPAIQVELALAPAPLEPAPGVLRLLVMDEEQAHRTENLSHLRLRLTRWGAAQAVALARRLAALLPAGPSSALRSFADRAETTPAMIGEEACPDLVIRLLAEVTRRGCPPSVLATRDLLARAAWEQAQVRAGDALKPFDERLLDRLMAGLAARHRTRTEDVRSWTWAPRAVVMETLRAAMGALLGPAAGRPLAALVAEAKQAKGAARQAAFEALELTLASEPAEAVLDALIRGGVFAEEDRYTGVFLAVVEPTVAAIWAARGLSELPPFDPDWLRLLDPDWLFVLDELGRRGLRMEALQARLEGHPEELRLDAAAWRVRFALVSAEPIPMGVLLPAWATMVWAEAHGMFSTRHISWQTPWAGWVRRALRELSTRHRDGLPVFDEDPVVELARLVPESDRVLIELWRQTPQAGVVEPERTKRWGFFGWVDLQDREELARLLCQLCPDQVVPTRPWSLEWCSGRDLARGIVRLGERAKAGDDQAARLLDGRAWLEAREEQVFLDFEVIPGGRPAPLAIRIWRHMPACALLSWAAAAGHTGPAAALLLQELGGRLKPEEIEGALSDLLRLATAAGSAEVEDLCARSLLRSPKGYRPLDAGLAVKLAGRLRMKELLLQVVHQPAELLPDSRLRVRDARVTIEPDWWVQPLVVEIEEQHGHTLGAQIELVDILDEMERDAHQAAIELFHLGEPAALRDRYIRGPRYLLDLPIWRDLARAGGLFSLLACEFPSLYFRFDELVCLARFAREDLSAKVRGSAQFALLRRRGEGVVIGRPALLETLVRWAPVLRPELLAIGDGVLTLLAELPDELPAEVEHLLIGGHRTHMTRSTYQGLHLHESWRSRAVHALLDLGDDGPLSAWAHASDRQSVSSENDMPIHEVIRWIGEDVVRLDRAWAVVQAEHNAGRLTGDRLEEVEWLLLMQGSAGYPDDPVRPRRYVVDEALRTTASEVWMRLHDRNSAHRDWVPVIRRAMQSKPNPRTYAALAFDLSRHVPDSPELARAIEYWALKDPDPFLGGPDFDWRGGRAVGGVTPLLAALAVRSDSWVNDGVVRLWQMALRLPISNHRPTYTTVRWDEEPPAELMVLDVIRGECPPPLDALARLLEARGMSGEILRAWEAPPLEPVPEIEGGHERPWWLRAWLRPWWLRHADERALRHQLQLDPACFPMDVLEELLRRRAPGLASFATHLALVTDHLVLRPLLETSPGAAVEVVAERAAQPIAPIRIELAVALEEAGSRGHRHLGVLRRLRALVGKLGAPEAAQPDQGMIMDR